MKNKITNIIIFINLFGFILANSSGNDSDRDLNPLRKPAGRTDEAVGVMTKGQLQNLTMNFGQITDTRLADPGNAPTDDFFNFRYPRKNYSGLVDDFSLIFAVEKNSYNNNNGNVIDGYTANNNEDWIAKDGSLGNTHYDGNGDHEMVTWFDGTPYLAHSDLPATWPVIADGEPFWPGYFLRDSTGAELEGVFASDRDVYAVFTDANNQKGDRLGLEVEQMAYCYGNPLAEDIQFYEFFIHNTSNDTIKNAWIGHYHDPDCSDYGEETLLLPDPEFNRPDIPDIIIQRDFDGDIGGATNPNSKGAVEDYTYGVIVLETPKNLGVTDFHYFTDMGPSDNHQLWPIISSQKNDADIASMVNDFFHGDNPKIDDVSLITEKLDLAYLAASGPFDLLPGQMVKYTLAVVVGKTDTDFMKNASTAAQIFQNGFAGPKPPPSPVLSGIADDGKVTLYWDDSAELQPDIITKIIDFEGYKIYRSEDEGISWGDEITDAFGEVIGYVPIAQFDLANGISGLDSLNTNFYLGDDAGLRHLLVDTTVTNGKRYAYTITSYDHGAPGLQALESSRGTSEVEQNYVSVVPTSFPSAKQPANIHISHIRGKTQCWPEIEIIDPNALSQPSQGNYLISFTGSPADSFVVSQNNQILARIAINGYDLPIVDGLTTGFFCNVPAGGISTVTDGNDRNVWAEHPKDFQNVNSTGLWTATVTETPGAKASLEARTSDFEFRFTENGSWAFSLGKPENSQTFLKVPFEIWNISENRDFQVNCQIKENNANQMPEAGEAIYIVNSVYSEPEEGDFLQAEFPDDFPYIVTFWNVNSNPDLPETGEFVKISSFSPPLADDLFEVEIIPAQIKAKLENNDLAEVRIVPNPYVVTAEWEYRTNVRSVHFMYLPPECKISIYTLSGTKVKELNHWNGAGDETWDLTNDFGEDLAFGVYVYVVKAGEAQKVGKFALIK